MNIATGYFYGGAYSGEIHWVDETIQATDISGGYNQSFYDWEIDELSGLELQIVEVVDYFE